MNVSEAIVKTRGKKAGLTNRASVEYADSLIDKNENVKAATTANIRTSKEHYPAVFALTDQRLMIVHKMLNLKRVIAYPYERITVCTEKVSKFQYIAVFFVDQFQFTASFSPRDGEAIAPFLHALKSFQSPKEYRENKYGK